MPVPFIDRRLELSVLEEEWRRPGLRVVIVYGRRRVGKTRLLAEWLRGRRGAYYEAVELSPRQLAEELRDALTLQLRIPLRGGDVVELLEEVAEATQRQGRVAVVLDEFQYMAEADPSLPSRLARSIDTTLSTADMVLVLSGSAASWFEKSLLAYRAPLHGRATARLRLRPLRFLEATGFWPGMDPVEALRGYSIVGGTPAYLAQVYGAASAREVLSRVMAPGSPLLEEAVSLLRQELREPRSYAALLRAVASGYTRPAEAANAAGIDPRTVHHYVAVLEELDIVRRRTPLGRRRGARLEIIDEYFRFYYSLLEPLRSLVEAGAAKEAIQYAEKRLDRHASKTLEHVVEQSLPELARIGALGFTPTEWGPWWHRGEEIDLVALRRGEAAAFIEAKWSTLSLREAKALLQRLEAKAAKTGLTQPRNTYILVARRVEGAEAPVTLLDEARRIVDYTKAYPLLAGAATPKPPARDTGEHRGR